MQLLDTGSSEEKEVQVALGEEAFVPKQTSILRCNTEGKRSPCKVRATNQCATSPDVGEVLSLASCYNEGATSQTWIFGTKGDVK